VPRFVAASVEIDLKFAVSVPPEPSRLVTPAILEAQRSAFVHLLDSVMADPTVEPVAKAYPNLGAYWQHVTPAVADSLVGLLPSDSAEPVESVATAATAVLRGALVKAIFTLDAPMDAFRSFIDDVHGQFSRRMFQQVQTQLEEAVGATSDSLAPVNLLTAKEDLQTMRPEMINTIKLTISPAHRSWVTDLGRTGGTTLGAT
jgi:hypothetical protein